jgi:DnaJ-class molecular chaperone
MTPETIVARFDHKVGQWIAHFEHTPQVAFGGDLAVVAIRRLLDGTEAHSDTDPLVCDWDQNGGGGVLHRDVVWQSPEVLFPCPLCKGSGRFVGFMKAGTCKAWGGRKVVPG